VNGEVVLFADKITGSIRDLLEITEDRRRRQMEHNRKHGITPHSVKRPVQESLRVILEGEDEEPDRSQAKPLDVTRLIRELEIEMKEASGKLEYERAALLRDQIMELRGGGNITPAMSKRKKNNPTTKSKKGWKR
jgi:excinuclease ABC subunit B